MTREDSKPRREAPLPYPKRAPLTPDLSNWPAVTSLRGSLTQEVAREQTN